MQRSAAVLLVCATALLCAGGPTARGQFRAYLDESEKAEVLLKLARGYLDDGRHELAVPLLVEALEIGPDAVLPSTGQGACLAARDLIDGLPAPALELYRESIAPKAQASLAAAESQGGIAAYAELARAYPRTAVGRRAAEHVWAAAFEQGNFPRARECLSSYLADSEVPAETRRLALVVMGIACAETGDRSAARSALDELKRLPGESPLMLCGSKVDAAACLERWLEGSEAPRRSWNNVGGSASRSAIAPAGLDFSARAMLAAKAASTRPAPDIEAMLAGAPAGRERVAESIVLATERSFLVADGADLVVYSRATGRERWRRALRPCPLPLTWPSCGDGYVAATVVPGRGPRENESVWGFMQDASQRLVVLDEDTGHEVWSWGPVNGDKPELAAPAARDIAAIAALEPLGSPLVYGGRVFVGAAERPRRDVLVDCFLVCFDLSTGQFLWKRFLGSGPVGRLPPDDHTLDRMVPVTDGRRVYVESGAQSLAAIDLATVSVAWARSFDRPRPNRQNSIADAAWPSLYYDAPTITGDRIIVTRVFGSTLRCLSADRGETLWEVKMPPMWRVGVHGDTVLWAGQSSLIGYDLQTGEERIAAELPAEATGRGFVAADAAYVPTGMGVVRVTLPGGTVALVTGSVWEPAPCLAVAPAGELVLNLSPVGAELRGSMNALMGEAARGRAAYPSDPGCSLRLAELCHQKADFARADRYLRTALGQAKTLGDADAAAGLVRVIRSCTVLLYRDWATALRKSGRADEALSRLTEVLETAPTESDRLLARMALAEHREAVGDREAAVTGYSEVVANELAQQRAVATGTRGLWRTLAAEAEMALRRARGDPPMERACWGICRADAGRLVMKSLGAAPSQRLGYVVAVPEETFAPLVRVWSDMLAAQNAEGDVRWLLPVASLSDAGPLSVEAVGRTLVTLCPARLTAQDIRSGDTRWQVPLEGRTAAAPTAADFLRARARARFDGETTVVASQVYALSGHATRLLVTKGSVLLVAREADAKASRLIRLDLATGRETWSIALPEGFAVRGTATEDENVAALLRADDGRLLVLCVDEQGGQEVWRHEDTVPRGRKLAWLFGGGLLVYNDSTGSCAVVRAGDGQVLWHKRVDRRWLPGAAPLAIVGGRVILSAHRGYVAVEAESGRVLWRSAAERPKAGGRAEVVTETLLMTAVGDEVRAVRLDTGRPAWSRKLDGIGEGGCGLVACNDVVIVYGRRQLDAVLHVLDAASGETLDAMTLGVDEGFLELAPIRGGLLAWWNGRLFVVGPTEPTQETGSAEQPASPAGRPQEPPKTE